MGLYLNPNADAFMEDGTRLCVFEPLNLSFQASAFGLGRGRCRRGGFIKKIFSRNPLKIRPCLTNVKKT